MTRLLLFLLLIAPNASASEVTLLHFSDYHSHATPFFSEDRKGQGGVAHAIGYLAREKRKGALVFSGGDMINKGSPAWSDKYSCAEWPWFNGIVDAMAYGNHDADYGTAEFVRCRALLRYPMLGANVIDAKGNRIFDVDGKPYVVFERNGHRIGVFATAGGDFASLVRAELRPVAGAEFTDRVAAARDVVRRLRESERVNAVVMIGHAHREDDEALARDVPGIDLIFGTHSHSKVPLMKIDGTSTHYMAPYQYLTYVSRAGLRFDASGRLIGIDGALVPIDSSIRAPWRIRRRVAAMQKALERDPAYAHLFRVIGRAPRDYSLANQLEQQTPLAELVLDIVRRAANADVALSTTSSFRRAIPAGPLRLEELRATLPYPNRVLVYELTRDELAALLALSDSKKGTDSYAQVARADDEKELYRVATTDYLARVASGYADFFRNRKAVETEHEVRALFQRYIEEEWQ